MNLNKRVYKLLNWNEKHSRGSRQSWAESSACPGDLQVRDTSSEGEAMSQKSLNEEKDVEVDPVFTR